MSAVLLAAAVVGGTAATYLFEDDERVGFRAGIGAPLGIVALGLVGYLLAWAVGVSAAVALLAGAIVLFVPALLLRRRGGWARVAAEVERDRAAAVAALRRPGRATVATLLFYVLMAVLVTRLFDRAYFEAPGGGGGVFTGVDHNLGDLPFHLAIATSFVYGHNVPPEHPELTGTRLTYPFMVDLVAALLVAAGATLHQAFRMETLVLAWSATALLHRFALRLTRDRLAALLAPVLVLASGGLGFLMLAQDVDPAGDGLVGLLRRPPRDYTIVSEGPFRWGNVVITMMIPQRSFLLGLPLFLVVATLWWEALSETDAGRVRRRLLAAGAVTGLMPLAHAHAFSTAVAITAALAVLFREGRPWGRSLGLALALALPQVLLVAWGGSVDSTRFLDGHVGWDRGDVGVLRFWWLNLGLFLPALLAAVAWRGRRPVVEGRLLRFYVPFAFCFVVPNLLRLSPWIWDNLKFMVWWHLASAPLVALLLARLWREEAWRRVAAGILLVLLTLSGALDLWRCASRAVVHNVIPPEGTLFAEDMRAATPPRAVVLHAPTYNSEVYLTGRRTVMGYFGHIWSQGLDSGAREDEVKRFYGGDPGARDVLARYEVDYVLVGPRERLMEGFDAGAVEGLERVAERGPYQLYRAR